MTKIRGRGIDHLVICTRNLNSTALMYERLGFKVTPRADHSWGTSNRLVQLQGSFLEILTVDRAELIEPHAPGKFSFGAFNRDFLARYEGMSMLVLESGDAQADRDEFAGKGIGDFERFDFSRLARQPNGEQVSVSFSLAFAVHPAAPLAGFFTCQQHAPEYFWKPEYQDHPNGALAIAEVVMDVPDQEEFEEFYKALEGSSSVRDIDGGFVCSTDRGDISVLEPDAYRRRFPHPDEPNEAPPPSFGAAVITVEDIDLLEELLEENDVHFVPVGREIHIPPKELHGFTVAFRQA